MTLAMSMPAPVPQSPRRLRAAHVLRPHGVRGTLRAEPLGGDATRFFAGLRLFREDDGQPYLVRSARGLPEGDVLLDLEEVRSRAEAEALRGAYLCVGRGDARVLSADEWFVADLVGMRAVDDRGEELGTVIDVEPYPEQDVLVVRHRSRLRRYPMVREHVRRVDVERRVIELTPWQGEED